MNTLVSLPNNLKMPLVGLGTWAIDFSLIEKVLSDAYDIGYRKFDTAWLYKNESYIGSALKNLRLPRENIFITSKLHEDNLYFHVRGHKLFRNNSVRNAFFQSCKRLGTEYLDLYLIHWPFANNLYYWEEIVKLYNEGFIRSIGVSSFLEPHLEIIKKEFGILPHVNQFEISPYNANQVNIDYCRKNNIHVEAYSTFGTTLGNKNASLSLFQEPVLIALAEKYKKSISQIILKWAVQRGISVIPRSKSRIHLKENISIFDFELSENDLESINRLDKGVYNRWNPYATLK